MCSHRQRIFLVLNHFHLFVSLVTLSGARLPPGIKTIDQTYQRINEDEKRKKMRKI